MIPNEFLRKIRKKVFRSPQGPLGAEGAPNPKIIKNALKPVTQKSLLQLRSTNIFQFENSMIYGVWSLFSQKV